MELELTLDSLDGLDESIQKLYQKGEDGKFRLQVKGIEDTNGLKSALEKERSAKRDAETAKKILEEKYKGVDLEKYQSIMDQFSNDEEAKLMAEGRMNEVLNKRTERMTKEYEKEKQTIIDERDSAIKRAAAYEAKVFENSIRQEATKSGIHSYAIDDAILRSKGIFKLGENGELQALDAEGNQIYGKDGKTGLSVAEWFLGQKEAAPHWFPAVQGSGGGGEGGKGGSGNNPWKDGSWNMTEQGRIFKENPDRARDLAAQAGHKI